MSKASIIKKTAIMICSIGFFVLLVYLIVDVSGSIILDADSGTVFVRDGAAGNYGQFIRNGSNDLTIASGATQAVIFTGSKAAFQGNLSVAGSQVDFTALPTSDPGVAGRLWRDGTTVKISV